MIKDQQIKLSFLPSAGIPPLYSNAVLLNIVADGTFILDFGFFDPLFIKESLKLPVVESHEFEHEVKPVTRVLLTRDVAQQLLNNLTLALNHGNNIS
jgi:hypothetical protein